MLLQILSFFGFYDDRTSAHRMELFETEAFFEMDELDEAFIYERF